MTKRNALHTAVFCLAVAAATLAASGRTYAGAPAPADWLTGVWAGQARLNSRSFTLIFTAADKTSLRFGAPLSCHLILTPASKDENNAVFNIGDSTGGRCDSYLGGTAKAERSPDKGKLVLTLNGRSDAYKIRTYLATTGAAAKTAKAKTK